MSNLKKLTLLTILGVGALSLSFLLVSASFGDTKAEDKEGPQQVKTTPVESASSTRELVYSGTLEGVQETDLSMQVSGKVASIDVEVGDKVEAGQILASSESNKQYVQKSNMLDYYYNSLSNLEKTKELMDQQVENAKKDVQQAEKNLQLAKTARENEGVVQPEKVKEAELQLNKAKTKRRNIVNSLEQKEQDILDNALSSISRGTVLTRNAIDVLYSVNEEKLPDTNNDFAIDDKFVGAGSQLVIDTEHKVVQVKEKVMELEDIYEKKVRGIENAKKNKDTIVEAAQEATDTLEETEEVLRDMKDILNNSIVHSDLTRRSLDQYKEKVSTQINKVQEMLLSYDGDKAQGLVGVEQALENLETQRDNQLSSVDSQIELARQKLELLDSSHSTKNKTLEDRVEIAKTEVEKAKQGLATAKARRESRIQEMRTEVDRAQGQLKSARVNVDDTLLKSPYQGVVTKKYIDQGRVVNPGTPVLRIADTSQMKVVAYIPKNKTENISVGEKVELAHNDHPGKQWQAEVTNISPASEQSSQKVKVELVSGELEELNIGMYVDIELQAKEGDDLVVVPSDSVTDFYGTSVVYVIKEGKAEKRKIEVKEEAGDLTYVNSGVTAGEKVATDGVERLNDGEEVKVVQ